MRSLPSLSLLLVLALTACGGIEFLDKGEGYSPGRDPLVEAHFERLLVADGIAYQRDFEGMYRAIKRYQQNDLERAGERARQLDPARESLKVNPGCAADRLRNYLDESGALYVVTRDSGDGWVQMTESDFTRLSVAEHFEQYRQDCAN